MLLAPIGNPEPRDASRLPARSVLQNSSHFEVSTGDPPPLDAPHIFFENGTQTVKMQFDIFPQKIQKEAAAPVVCSLKLPFDVKNLLPQNRVSNFCTKVRCVDFIALL